MIPTAAKKELSVDEAELYDRQIRLWGIASQEKLRAANILLIGANSLGSEIAKNILLAGINSLTILDSRSVAKENVLVNLFLNEEDVGKNVAESVAVNSQELNPLVKIEAVSDKLQKQTNEFYKKFTLIVATGLKIDEIISLDDICRKNSIKLICGDTFGMFAFSVTDFLNHTYHAEEIKLAKQKRKIDSKPQEPTTVNVEKVLNYPAFNKVFETSQISELNEKKKKRLNPLFFLMRALLEFRTNEERDPCYDQKTEDLKKLTKIREKILHDFQINEDMLQMDVFELAFGEIVPVSAIVGGIIGQEIIKGVSEAEVPIHNVFLFDPNTYNGTEVAIAVQ